MFDLRIFLKQSLLDMIGYKPDREIRYAASKWFEKGTLFEEDLAEIEAKLDIKNAQEKDIEQEEPTQPASTSKWG